MKVLIIGASGFIGRACFSNFSRVSETIGFSRSGLSHNNFIVGATPEILPALVKQKFDVIINCVGSSNIQDSFLNSSADFESNVSFTQYVLDLIKNLSKETKFINLSSAAVYGNPAKLPVTETTPLSPLSPYGFHKLLSEDIVARYTAFFGLNALSVRIFSAYGPGLNRQLFHDLYTKFTAGHKTIELVGTGKESRDFIFISDITSALEVLINKAAFRGETYNLGSQQESFIQPTAQLFADICNFKGDITFNQQQFKGYPNNWKADIAKLSSLGYSPKIPLKEGLSKYFNWLKTPHV